MAVYLCQRRSVDDQGIKKSPSVGCIYLFSGTAFTSSIQPASLDDGSADDMFMPVVFLS